MKYWCLILVLILISQTNMSHAAVVYVDVNPDVTTGNYTLVNPFGNEDLSLEFDFGGFVLFGDYTDPVAITVPGGNDQIEYLECGEVIGPASSVWIDGWEFGATDGDYYFGFIFNSDAGEQHFGWIHVSVDTGAESLTIIEYAYEDQPGTNIEICDADGGTPQEICDNGIDDDGDGLIDEDDPDCDVVADEEICGNGIDDDGDGLIDFLDDDCPCGGGVVEENLILNPSFEEFECIPDFHSQLNCVGTSENVGMGTADYFHTDGYYPDIFPPPLTGNAIIGGHGFNSLDLGILLDNTEYQEAFTLNITEDLEGGEDYIFSFSSAQFEVTDDNDESFLECNSPDAESLTPYRVPFEIVLYGYATNPPIPYFNAFQPTWQCPIELDPMWVELGSIQFELDNNWQQFDIQFTVPAGGINTIAVGWACTYPDVFDISSAIQCVPYFIFDDVSIGISNGAFFEGEVDLISTGSFCTEDLEISAQADFEVTSYTWYFNGVEIPGEDNNTLNVGGSGNEPGEYSVLVMGQQGCATEVIALVDTGLDDVVFIDEVGLICGQNEYEVVANVTTTANLIYTWTTADGNIVSGEDTPSVLVDQSGLYTLTAQIGACVIASDVEIVFSDLPPPIADFIWNNELFCDFSTLHLTDQSQSNSELTDFFWEITDVGVETGEQASFDFVSSGIFEVSHIVLDQEGCFDDTTMTILMEQHMGPEAFFTYNVENNELDVQFDESSTGTILDWNWDHGDNTFHNGGDHIYQYLNGGEYDVTLIVTDNLGCQDQAIRPLILKDPVLIYIPNSFTPDKDGVNEQWKWSALGVSEVEVAIFDRYGHEVFNSIDPNGFWNGSVNANNYFAPDGTYTYLFRYKQELGFWQELTGNVTLLR